MNDYNEELEKELNFQEYVDQYKQARDTLRDKWGIDMDETDSEIFWRAFDDPDIIDAFGSTNVLYMGEEVRADDTVTTRQAAEIAKGTAAEAVGQEGMTSEDIRNAYNINFNNYKTARKSGLSHKEAIDYLFR